MNNRYIWLIFSSSTGQDPQIYLKMLSILLATRWNMTKKILPSCSVPKVLMKDQFFLVQQTLVPIIFEIFWSEKKKSFVKKNWERKKMHIVEVVALIIMMNVVNNWTEALFYLWNWPLTRQFNQLVKSTQYEKLAPNALGVSF